MVSLLSEHDRPLTTTKALSKRKRKGKIGYDPTPDELTLLESLFFSNDESKTQTHVDFDEASEILSKSRLPESVIKIILTMTKDSETGQLDKKQFFTAVRLVQLRQNCVSVQNLKLTVPDFVHLNPPYFGDTGSSDESNTDLNDEQNIKVECFNCLTMKQELVQLRKQLKTTEEELKASKEKNSALVSELDQLRSSIKSPENSDDLYSETYNISTIDTYGPSYASPRMDSSSTIGTTKINEKSGLDEDLPQQSEIDEPKENSSPIASVSINCSENTEALSDPQNMESNEINVPNSYGNDNETNNDNHSHQSSKNSLPSNSRSSHEPHNIDENNGLTEGLENEHEGNNTNDSNNSNRPLFTRRSSSMSSSRFSSDDVSVPSSYSTKSEQVNKDNNNEQTYRRHSLDENTTEKHEVNVSNINFAYDNNPSPYEDYNIMHNAHLRDDDEMSVFSSYTTKSEFVPRTNKSLSSRRRSFGEQGRAGSDRQLHIPTNNHRTQNLNQNNKFGYNDFRPQDDDDMSVFSSYTTKTEQVPRKNRNDFPRRFSLGEQRRTGSDRQLQIPERNEMPRNSFPNMRNDKNHVHNDEEDVFASYISKTDQFRKKPKQSSRNVNFRGSVPRDLRIDQHDNTIIEDNGAQRNNQFRRPKVKSSDILIPRNVPKNLTIGKSDSQTSDIDSRDFQSAWKPVKGVSTRHLSQEPQKNGVQNLLSSINLRWSSRY